mgnify:CR=1 FL=1
MKKMIIIERSKFAQIMRNYKKALHMSAVLEHICRERKSAITLTTAEICELIQLDLSDVAKHTQRGRLRCDMVKGVRYYDIMDLINLKDLLDSQAIFRQTMDQAIPDTAIKIQN